MAFIDFNHTFDTTNALAALFLWLIFGFLSHMINCDLQRLLESSALVRHLTGLLAFFFLFTFIDSKSNQTQTSVLVLKTVLVYILFIFTTKSKWYFVVPVLALLFLDQILKKHYEFNQSSDTENAAELTKQHSQMNNAINILVVSIILVGMIHYMYLQKVEYKDKFSLYTFFVETNKNCKPYHPNYSKMRG